MFRSALFRSSGASRERIFLHADGTKQWFALRPEHGIYMTLQGLPSNCGKDQTTHMIPDVAAKEKFLVDDSHLKQEI
jgi:hypothetical protein